VPGIQAIGLDSSVKKMNNVCLVIAIPGKALATSYKQGNKHPMV
jgi:hypothetical protein